MEEVLDVYERAYDEKYPVVCLDESPQQLIGEARPPFTDGDGVVRQDYEYVREGVADIFMVCEPLAGQRSLFVTENHKTAQWAQVVAHIAEEMYPGAEKITLVQDNLATHNKAALYNFFKPERARAIIKRIEFVFTPKHGSWLNMAEIELSVFKRVALKQRVGSKGELERIVGEYQQARNSKKKKLIGSLKRRMPG